MTQALPAVPPRPPRDTRVDITRGILQLTIFASHADGSFIGAWLIHKAWGLSDSSEQFLFLSGYMLGSVFARKSLLQGWWVASRDMLKRGLDLYRTHLLVFCLFGVMIALACKTGLLPDELVRLGWGYMVADPLRAIPAALATLYLPQYVNILPVFVWCMLTLPLFAWLEARYGAWSLLVPGGIDAAVWVFGLSLQSPAPDMGLGFNPFAWQILFMFGAWLGRRTLMLGQALPAMRWLTVAAVVVVLFALWLRLGWHGFLPWGAPLPDLEVIWNKNDLAPLRLLHALALAWLVSCLVPRERPWMHGAVGRWLATGGRYSLQIFCLGLFLAWGVTAAFRLLPTMRWWLDPILLTSGCFALLLFAKWLDRDKNVPPLAVAAVRG